MKVIDLLNKIANGEEVPNIKVRDRIYKFCTTNFAHNDSGHLIFGFDFEDLTDEIEIIEEDKEIEEIEELSIRWKDNDIIVNGKVMQEDIDEVFVDKINELVKAVNELKKGK